MNNEQMNKQMDKWENKYQTSKTFLALRQGNRYTM